MRKEPRLQAASDLVLFAAGALCASDRAYGAARPAVVQPSAEGTSFFVRFVHFVRLRAEDVGSWQRDSLRALRVFAAFVVMPWAVAA